MKAKLRTVLATVVAFCCPTSPASFLAHAADVTVVGTPGVNATPGTNGGPGEDATAITAPNSDPTNTATATGGAGGTGGIANPPVRGGSGGAGGNATAIATTSTADSAGNGFAAATATGGAGGTGGAGDSASFTPGGSAGSGGSATSNAIVINVPNASPLLPRGEPAATVALPLAAAWPAVEVEQTPKQPPSLATKSRSLPPQ
jgi:hypothetical protein